MKHFKDVIARKRPRPSTLDADPSNEESVTDFREIARTRERLSSDEPVAADRDAETAAIAPDPVPDPEPEPKVDPVPDLAAPAPVRNQIWDLENNKLPEADPDPRRRAQRAQVAAETLRKIEAQEKLSAGKPVARTASDPASKSRAKTRILGFHAGDLDGDVFAVPKAASAEAGHFPAGWIVVVDGPGRGASFTVCAGVSTVGRDAGQSICLDFGDMSVSRENHASIAYDDEQNKFFIGHGGKSNIVRRNGNPVLATEELADGDQIRIGKTTLRFVALCGSDFTWGGEEDMRNADDAED